MKTGGNNDNLTIIKAFAILFLLVVTLVGGTLFAYGRTLENKIYPGVTAGQQTLGGLTVDQAWLVLDQAAAQYNLAGIKISIGTNVISPAVSDLGIQVNIEKTLEQAYRVGRENKITEQFGVPSLGRTINVPYIYDINYNQFTDYLYQLDYHYGTPVENPSLEIIKGQVAIAEGHNGARVKFKDFSSILLATAAEHKYFSIDLDTETIPKNPIDDDLFAAQEQMQKMITKPIKLTYDDRLYELNQEILADWLVYQPDHVPQIYFSETKAADFFIDINNEVGNEPKNTFGYQAKNLGEYAYKNSQGQKADIGQTLKQLTEIAAAETEKTVSIAMTTIDPDIEYLTADVPLSEGKVISVNLSRQSLFAHENGELLFWTRVSTGINDWTPTGEWKVNTKTPIQKMSGPGYYLPGVKWVMPYNGDYTLHTAYWHDNFGNPMSHGCINMYEADAKWLFDWTEVGTPVIIYKDIEPDTV
ncbi:L,D-transpeptidase family protein [Patescibacteria group bacterium]